jgi:hypothetical protein
MKFSNPYKTFKLKNFITTVSGKISRVQRYKNIWNPETGKFLTATIINIIIFKTKNNAKTDKDISSQITEEVYKYINIKGKRIIPVMYHR